MDHILIESPNWIKTKKETINSKNKDDKCSEYGAMVTLNYEEIKWNPERVSNIKPFINKYNWDEIKYPLKIDNWKTFEKNNPTVAFNGLYTKEMEICPTYISKINSNCEKQIILLMIPNIQKYGWHYLAVKKLSTR